MLRAEFARLGMQRDLENRSVVDPMFIFHPMEPRISGQPTANIVLNASRRRIPEHRNSLPYVRLRGVGNRGIARSAQLKLAIIGCQQHLRRLRQGRPVPGIGAKMPVQFCTIGQQPFVRI